MRNRSLTKGGAPQKHLVSGDAPEDGGAALSAGSPGVP